MRTKTPSKTSLANAAPDLYACIKSFVVNWPQFGTDKDVNGADLVDWLAEQHPYWVDALSKAEGNSERLP